MRIRSEKVKMLLRKSIESALLAVDVYNRPSTKFRTFGYIVLMTIAWTALFHAMYERQGIKYFYKRKNSRRYQIIDGERRAWDISECLAVYYGDRHSPVKTNIEFFIGLRNKIEHRFLPALDLATIGECQSLLMNFEKFLVSEFGEKYSLNESLAIPLHLLSVNPEWRNKVLRELQSEQYQTVRRYIDAFRFSLDAEVLDNPEFSFRVFLIPKVGNHESSSDLAIEFVRYNPDNPEEMEQYERFVAFVKDRRVQVAVINPGRLKAGEVSARVELGIHRKFGTNHHAKCWKDYEVRPCLNDSQPEMTKTQYCHYDAVHKDYVYTEEWVEFLITQLSDPDEWKRIFG